MTTSDQPAAQITGAEELLEAAVAQGIEVCFANPGTSEMHFVAAIDKVGHQHMRPVLGLHETVCSGAADGYGRMTGKPALTLLHLGPGLANALANLHNARRAGTPIVNLIGDMATWHKGADPLLNMDIVALAGTVSKDVIVCDKKDVNLSDAMIKACTDTRFADVAGGSRISTLIVPHDRSWELRKRPTQESTGSIAPGLQSDYSQFINECADALKATSSGNLAIYIGGTRAGTASALKTIGQIAAALKGAPIYCENAFPRLDRGAGLPVLQRIPYFPQDAVAALSKYTTLLLIDVRRPVANFGYQGGPSQLVNQDDAQVWELDSGEIELDALLKLLCTRVGGDAIKPFVNCRGAFCSPARPELPTGMAGRLTADTMCRILAHVQPPGSVIVDESLTSGTSYWEASRGCPQFSHLTLTGGAIGCGPPMSVGAAIACPDRVVINFQADGSGMYSLQALWTQAREELRVVTVICANKSYAILKVELAKQRISPSTGPATKALTELGGPPLDWVSLAKGMGVPAGRVTTNEEFYGELKRALDSSLTPGPYLIEACI